MGLPGPNPKPTPALLEVYFYFGHNRTFCHFGKLRRITCGVCESFGELPEMSEEAGAAPTAASADGAVADSTMADASPVVETAEEVPVCAEPPAATGATATAAPQQREADKTAAELVAAEEKRAQAGMIARHIESRYFIATTTRHSLTLPPGTSRSLCPRSLEPAEDTDRASRSRRGASLCSSTGAGGMTDPELKHLPFL